jgi:quinol monooxygenase YgiN
MEALGLLVTLEARAGKEADAEAFLKSAQPLALNEKGTLKWYAIKIGPGKFGIFDTFANEAGRNAHLTGEIAKALGARASELFATPPQGRKSGGPCNQMKTETQTAKGTKQIHLTRHSPNYWRVTIDHPPLNIFGPDTIPQLDEAITAIETDKDVKVVVFDSAVEGFFLTHYDFVAPVENTTRLPPGPTGLHPLPNMLVRLSRAPVVSIASIRGRATGVGSELGTGLRHAVRQP